MHQWKTPVLGIVVVVLTTVIGVTGCTGAPTPNPGFGNHLGSPDNVVSNRALSARQIRPAGHAEGKGNWTNVEQTIHMDKEQRRVTIFLTGLTPLQENQSFDTTRNPRRLLVKVPKGWMVNCGIPMKSSYMVSMVPTDMRIDTGVSPTETVKGGIRYGPILQTAHAGTYNLVVLLPGQKGGHIIDVVEVTSVDSPSVTPI